MKKKIDRTYRAQFWLPKDQIALIAKSAKFSGLKKSEVLISIIDNSYGKPTRIVKRINK